MVGFKKLTPRDMPHILNGMGFTSSTSLPTSSTRPLIVNSVRKNDEYLIISTPIPVQTLPAFLSAIQKQEFNALRIVVGFENNGHIITHFIPKKVDPDQSILAFDSSITHLPSFYAHETNFFKKITAFFSNLITSLHPRPRKAYQLGTHTVIYRSAGIQSVFDDRTSYFHHANHLIELQKNLNEVAPQINIGTIFENNSTFTSTILKNTRTLLNYTSFIKKAWYYTFLPNLKQGEFDKLVFTHYFLGWPTPQSRGKILFYLLTLSFITTPLINLIKAIIQFPFNLLTETANYWRNQFMAAVPSHPLVQYLRSVAILLTVGVQGLFNGVSLLINTVTSPIDSFKQAWGVNKILGILSALISLTAIAAIAVFVTPLFIHGLSSVTPTLISASHAAAHVIATSVVKIPLLSALASASVLIASATIFLKGIKAGLNRIFDFDRSKRPSSYVLAGKGLSGLSAADPHAGEEIENDPDEQVEEESYMVVGPTEKPEKEVAKNGGDNPDGPAEKEDYMEVSATA